MANTTARFDPSIVIDTQFRVAREGSIVLDFYDSDGNPEDMYESEWEFILKKQANSPNNVLRLTTGAGNIVVQGTNDERVRINITAAQSNIPAYNYYFEIYRPDLRKTWFTGTCFVSNGIYNSSVNQSYVSTSVDEQTIRIELNSEGTPIKITFGSGGGGSSLELGETSTTAYRGDRGKTAYDHSQTSGNPHGTTASDVGADPSGSAAAAQAASQPKPTEVTGSITAAANGFYIVTASATFTDPTPAQAMIYTVLVRNGTATVGSVAYSTAGTLIRRVYHSGAWSNYFLLVDGSYQPLDSDLTSIAALSTTSYGRALLTLANAAAADWLEKVITATALTDAATIDLTTGNHTLTTSSATRTFTKSYTGDSIKILVTLNATACTITLPSGWYGIYNGTPSATNTLVITGAVSGDLIAVAIDKVGSTFVCIGKNLNRT